MGMGMDMISDHNKAALVSSGTNAPLSPSKSNFPRLVGVVRAVLNGKKKSVPEQFSQKSPRALHVLNHGWWRLAVSGWRRLAVGSWQLAVGGGWWLVIGGWWRLVVDDWWLVAVGSWRLVAAGSWQRLVAGGWWRLVAVGG